MTFDGKEYKAKDLMRPAVLIQETAQLKEALEALVREKSNIAVVVDGDGKFIGGVNTVDIIRAVLPDYIEKDITAAHFADTSLLREDTRKAATKQISDFVDTHDSTVGLETNVLEAAVIASAGCDAGRIVVVDTENKPVGILSRTEIKQVLAAFLGIKNELHELCAGEDC